MWAAIRFGRCDFSEPPGTTRCDHSQRTRVNDATCQGRVVGCWERRRSGVCGRYDRRDSRGCSGRVEVAHDEYFVFYLNKASWQILYERINMLEYGQKVAAGFGPRSSLLHCLGKNA